MLDECTGTRGVVLEFFLRGKVPLHRYFLLTDYFFVIQIRGEDDSKIQKQIRQQFLARGRL